MSLMGKIGRGVAAFSADTLLSNLLQLFAVARVYRYLTLEAYGTLALALTLHATGTIFLDFGLGPVFTSEIAKGRGEASPARVKLYTRYYTYLELITGSVLLVVYAVIGSRQAGVFRALWPIMGLYLLASALNNIAVTVFHSHTLYGYQAAQSMFRSAMRLLLLVTLPLWWNGNSLVGVALTFPFMELLTACASLLLVSRILRPLRAVSLSSTPRADMWRVLREQGLYSSIIIPVKRVQEQLPVWLTTSLAGSAAAGAYATAQGGFAILFSFFRGVETTLFPIVSERLATDQRLLRDTMRQTEKYSFWAGVAAVIGGWAFAPLFVRIIAGEAYLGATPVFRVMLLHLLVYAFAQVQRPLFYALGRQRDLFASYVVNLVEYGLLLVVGLVSLGVVGAAVSQVTSEAIIVYVRQWLLRRHDPQLAFDLKALFTINEHDRRLWQRLTERVRTALQSRH
jgi:O-antigen/teichoic acid export membrane protein